MATTTTRKRRVRKKGSSEGLAGEVEQQHVDINLLRLDADHLREGVASLDERLCDEVNKGHALYRAVEALAQKVEVLAEQMPGLRATDQNLERRVTACLDMEDLRKINTTISLLEDDIRKHEKNREHDANAFNLIRKAWDDANLDERVNMLECDMERLHSPSEIHREEKPSSRSVAALLGKACELVEKGGWRPGEFDVVQALGSAAVGYTQAIYQKAVHELFHTIQFVWGIHPKGDLPELSHAQYIQLINEWNDGYADNPSILLALKVTAERVKAHG